MLYNQATNQQQVRVSDYYKSITKFMEKCAICIKQTDKCCSLCRKVFYCSPQHQEVHWHMTHKFACEGKHATVQSNQEDFKFYVQSQVKSSYQTKSYDEEAKVFMELFENRLNIRTEVLTQYTAARQANTPPILLKELLKECELLVDLSKKVTESYQAALSEHLQDVYGLITNSFIVKIDQLLDRVLQARCYQLALMARELRQILLLISSEMQGYPEYLGEQFKKSYRNLLWGIIDLSQNASLDKISERMFGYFIKLCERFDGIWEQVYAYFNMGMWYANKTYYHKAIKCFNYASELAAAHKLNQGSVILKADAIFNVALCSYAILEHSRALEEMQEAYRLRCQSLGKSSLQASEALFVLGKWCFAEKRYDVCLQYVMECLRIRKLNPSFAGQLAEVHSLIVQIYETIKHERDVSERMGSPNNKKYYDRLLESEMSYREQQGEKKESFTKRLLEEDRQLVAFKLIVTPELAETLTSQQWSKIGELIDLQDTKMDKQEAIRIILQSDFSQSLTEEQRIQFIKLNKIS